MMSASVLAREKSRFEPASLAHMISCAIIYILSRHRSDTRQWSWEMLMAICSKLKSMVADRSREAARPLMAIRGYYDSPVSTRNIVKSPDSMLSYLTFTFGCGSSSFDLGESCGYFAQRDPTGMNEIKMQYYRGSIHSLRLVQTREQSIANENTTLSPTNCNYVNGSPFLNSGKSSSLRMTLLGKFMPNPSARSSSNTCFKDPYAHTGTSTLSTELYLLINPRKIRHRTSCSHTISRLSFVLGANAQLRESSMSPIAILQQSSFGAEEGSGGNSMGSGMKLLIMVRR
jgi:hypothetical protein